METPKFGPTVGQLWPGFGGTISWRQRGVHRFLKIWSYVVKPVINHPKLGVSMNLDMYIYIYYICIYIYYIYTTFLLGWCEMTSSHGGWKWDALCPNPPTVSDSRSSRLWFNRQNTRVRTSKNGRSIKNFWDNDSIDQQNHGIRQMCLVWKCGTRGTTEFDKQSWFSISLWGNFMGIPIFKSTQYHVVGNIYCHLNNAHLFHHLLVKP